MSKKITVHEAKGLLSDLFRISMPYTKRNYCGNHYETPIPEKLRGLVEEIEGAYDELVGNAGTIILRTKTERKTIMPVSKTVYSDSIDQRTAATRIKKGDKLYIIGIKAEEPPVYIAVTVIREDEKWIFEQVKSLYGRVNAINNFYACFANQPGKRSFILNQLKGPRHARYESSQDAFFDVKEEQMLKYALCKETYSPETQKSFELMFRDKDEKKHRTEQRLGILSNISPSNIDRKPVIRDSLIEHLDKTFYKMERVKQLLVDVFVSNEKAGKRGFCILLVGEPGVGKTALMEALAKFLGMFYEGIPLNGMSCPLELEGIDPGYDTANAGRLILAFYAYKTLEMIIGFDEFDKMVRTSKEGDPMSVLYRILQGAHDDKFLGCRVSTENTIFIATANSTKDIPEPILNRFQAIIEMEEYSIDDRIAIASKHLIPKELQKFQLTERDVLFSDDVIRYIIMNYCGDTGVRDLKHSIEKIIRRCISSDDYSKITKKRVRDILGNSVSETPVIFYNRHREEYTETVSKEIQKCLQESKTQTIETSNEGEKIQKKLDCLLACRDGGEVLSGKFDPVSFSKELHADVHGMNTVIEEVTGYYHTMFLQGSVTTSNLALIGGYGTGKSTIGKGIAKAMKIPYVKVSLNGIDDIRELKGFPLTYIGSEPGIIMKGIKKAGSLRVLLLLDEIDKVKPEVAIALLDLLDREYTDAYLGVPVVLGSTLIIATANDWGKVPAVLKDRFHVIEVDGYSREEKAEIISDYVIPKIEKSFKKNHISISMEESARAYLLKTYCRSFGVRDVEKAMKKIVNRMLLEQVKTDNPYMINISKEDVRSIMGEEPIPNGNFPADSMEPGIAKALAVQNSNLGSAFAIETVLTEGDESIEMTGLPKESAVDSVRVAVTCIKKRYPDLLRGKHIHVHFGEGSVPKDGPSAGVALFMSIFSAATGKPLMIKKPYDIAYTGEISLTGGIFAVGGLYEKIQAAYDSGCKRVYVPQQNYERLDKKKLSQFKMDIIPVMHIEQVIDSVYPEHDLSFEYRLFQNRRGA